MAFAIDFRALLLSTALVAVPLGPALAHQDQTPPMTEQGLREIAPLTNAFFGALQAGDTAKAYRDLFAGTLMEGKPADMQNLATQTDVFLTAYGSVISWQTIRTDCLSPTLCRVIYQVDMKNGPLFVMLSLYRNTSRWSPTYIFLTDVPASLYELR